MKPRAAVDSSVAVAALAEWHEFHDAAAELAREAGLIPAHAALETYSVLTRLPHPYRVSPEVAGEAIAALYAESARLPLPVRIQRDLAGKLAGAGIGGGACYDGVVALTAAAAGAALISFDRRAARTYERLGIEYRLVAAG